MKFLKVNTYLTALDYAEQNFHLDIVELISNWPYKMIKSQKDKIQSLENQKRKLEDENRQLKEMLAKSKEKNLENRNWNYLR